MPAGSNTAPSTANAASMPNEAPRVASKMGTSATEVIDNASLTTATRRRPTMSTITPEKRKENANGSAVIAPMAAAAPALPVSSSTNQGKAISEIPLAMPLSIVDASSTNNGHSRFIGYSQLLRRQRGHRGFSWPGRR